MKHDLERKLSAACRRCDLHMLLRLAGRVLIAAGGVGLAAVLVERFLAWPTRPDWGWFVLAGLAAAIVVGIWLWRRPGRLDVAVRIDDALHTHTRFSSALNLADREDSFSRAAVAEAHKASQTFDMRGAFPVRPDRSWAYAGGMWAAVVAAALWMPQLDLLGKKAQQRQQQAQVQQVEKDRREMEMAIQTVQSHLKEMGRGDLAKDLAADLENLREVKPEQVRTEAIRKLSEIAGELRKAQNSPENDAARRLQNQLRKLRPTRDAFDPQLDRALAEGDFGEAADRMAELQKQLASGEMSAEDQEKAARQMENLAEQLAKLAQDRRDLERALRQAGQDPKMADMDPEELAKALENKGLTKEQVEQLKQQCQSCNQAGETMSDLAEALAQAACQNPDGTPREGDSPKGGLSAEDLSDLINQLKACEGSCEGMYQGEMTLEQIEAEMAKLGQGQGCEGIGMSGEDLAQAMGQPQGQGARPGPGAGVGAVEHTGGPAEELPPVSLEGTLSKSKQHKDDPAVASWYFRGEQIKGRAKRTLSEAVQAGRDRASEAISENRVPRRHEEAVKKYFGGLDKQGQSP